MRTSLLVLLIAACSSGGGAKSTMAGSAPPPTTTSPAPGPCDALADKLQPFFEGQKGAPPAKVFRDIIAKRCTTDGWSPEAMNCFNAIKTIDEGDKCDKLLTQTQQDALNRDGTEAMGKGQNVGAPPPPPGKGADGGDPCEGGE
jgi:hypothetical protein